MPDAAVTLVLIERNRELVQRVSDELELSKIANCLIVVETVQAAAELASAGLPTIQRRRQPR